MLFGLGGFFNSFSPIIDFGQLILEFTIYRVLYSMFHVEHSRPMPVLPKEQINHCQKNHYRKYDCSKQKRSLIFLLLHLSAFFLLPFSFLAAEEAPSYEFIELSHWRVRPATDEEFAKRRYEHKSKYKFQWTGKIGDGYKHKEVYDHQGKFVYYTHFHAGKIPENATPILIITNIAPDTEVFLNYKKLTRIEEKKKGDDPFDTVYWFEIPLNLLKQDSGSQTPNNGFIIWANKINKKTGSVEKAISRIVFEDPDKIAEQERKRKLRYPYLYDVKDTDDPYVARHW